VPGLKKGLSSATLRNYETCWSYFVDYLASGNADISLFDTPVDMQFLQEEFADWLMKDDLDFTPN
jgi:hypothetical protein